MQNVTLTKPTDESTDALYDTRPAAMAARFGDRVRTQLRQGVDVRQAARLAFSYAFLSEPYLRIDGHIFSTSERVH